MKYEINDEYQKLIPEHLRTGIQDYVNDGVITGGFLHAVFSNNLFEAIRCADSASLAALAGTAMWIYNFAPAICWGSREKVELYIKSKQEAA